MAYIFSVKFRLFVFFFLSSYFYVILTYRVYFVFSHKYRVYFVIFSPNINFFYFSVKTSTVFNDYPVNLFLSQYRLSFTFPSNIECFLFYLSNIHCILLFLFQISTFLLFFCQISILFNFFLSKYRLSLIILTIFFFLFFLSQYRLSFISPSSIDCILLFFFQISNFFQFPVKISTN